MAEKVHHLEGPWGWGEVGTVELVALACTAPHDCNARGCPGPVNKRKLEAFDDLLAALELLLDQETNLAGECGWCFLSPFGNCERPSCPGVIARAALAKTKEV